MIYYFTLLFLLILNFFLCRHCKNSKNKIIFLFISAIWLILVSTLRYGIGFDYFSYKDIFENISKTSLNELKNYYSIEILYLYLNKIISLLGGNYTTFILIINIFIISSVMLFIYKYSKNFYISIFVFITFQFFSHSMNLLRQTIAVVIFLFSYQFILKKKFISYAIIIFLGFFFHKSIILIFPMYFLLNIKFSFKYFILISFLAFILYIFSDYIFFYIFKNILKMYSNYSNEIYWNANSFKYIIFPTIYFIIVLIFKNKILKYNVLINTAFYTFLINLFITKHFIFERFSIYTFIFSIILIPEILESNKNIKINILGKNIDFYYILMFIILIVGLSYLAFASFENFHNVYPYKSIFDRISINNI